MGDSGSRDDAVALCPAATRSPAHESSLHTTALATAATPTTITATPTLTTPAAGAWPTQPTRWTAYRTVAAAITTAASHLAIAVATASLAAIAIATPAAFTAIAAGTAATIASKSTAAGIAGTIASEPPRCASGANRPHPLFGCCQPSCAHRCGRVLVLLLQEAAGGAAAPLDRRALR